MSLTFDSATYWTERHRRQGDTYVAKGGRRASYDRQLAAITPYFTHLPAEGRVLDFGCGPGRFRPALEARGLEYEGVDLIPGLGTMDVDDVESAGFDAAVAIFVLQHIVDHAEYVAAVRLLWSALRPGGTLLVVDHEPGDDMAEHMRPRGWNHIPLDGRVVGRYNGHWIGVFVR